MICIRVHVLLEWDLIVKILVFGMEWTVFLGMAALGTDAMERQHRVVMARLALEHQEHVMGQDMVSVIMLMEDLDLSVCLIMLREDARVRELLAKIFGICGAIQTCACNQDAILTDAREWPHNAMLHLFKIPILAINRWDAAGAEERD